MSSYIALHESDPQGVAGCARSTSRAGDPTQHRPDVETSRCARSKTAACLMLPQLAFRASQRTRRRFLVVRVVGRQGEEHQPRRRQAIKGARGAPTSLRRSPEWSARFATRLRHSALFPRYAPYVHARANEVTDRSARGRARRVVAQGRLAPARRRVSVARPITASASCACSRNVSPNARTAVWRVGETVRGDGAHACCRAIRRPMPVGASAALAALHVTEARAASTTT